MEATEKLSKYNYAYIKRYREKHPEKYIYRRRRDASSYYMRHRDQILEKKRLKKVDPILLVDGT